MDLKYELKGFGELDSLLRNLPARVELRVIKSALRSGARIVAKSAQAKTSGILASAIVVVTKKKRFGLGVQIGIDKRKDAYYAHMVEFGTDPHPIPYKKKGGQFNRVKKALKIGDNYFHNVNHPGAKPHPFMRPALDENMDAVINKIVQRLWAGFKREIAKLK